MRQAVIALQDSEIGQRAYLLTGQAQRSRALRAGPPAHRDRAAPARGGLGRRFRRDAAGRASSARRPLRSSTRSTAPSTPISSTAATTRSLRSAPDRARSTSDHIRQICRSVHRGAKTAAVPPARRAAVRAGAGRHRRASAAGRRLPLPVHRHVHRHPQRAGTWRDASAQLADRSHLLQSTLESLQDPIFVIDADGQGGGVERGLRCACRAGIPSGMRR